MEKIKSKCLFFIGLVFITTLTSCDAQNKNSKSITNKNMDSLSYSLGILLGDNVKNAGFEDIKLDALKQGMQDVLDGKETAWTLDQANKIVNDGLAASMEKKAGPAKEAGKKFLEENGKKPGVITTASGLQYEVMTKGNENGKRPTLSDKVTTHYKGTLIDGREFDSSYKRNEPTTFPVGGVIKGWTEALQLMHEGDKFKLYIPYELAYGERGAGADIPPYATLIFEIELIKIN